MKYKHDGTEWKQDMMASDLPKRLKPKTLKALKAFVEYDQRDQRDEFAKQTGNQAWAQFTVFVPAPRG